MRRVPARMRIARPAVIIASHRPAAASVAVAAQVIDENASANIDNREDVCRRRKSRRLAWARNQSWMAVADAAAVTIPAVATAARNGEASNSQMTNGANTSAIAPMTASILAPTTWAVAIG